MCKSIHARTHTYTHVCVNRIYAWCVCVYVAPCVQVVFASVRVVHALTQCAYTPSRSRISAVLPLVTPQPFWLRSAYATSRSRTSKPMVPPSPSRLLPHPHFLCSARILHDTHLHIYAALRQRFLCPRSRISAVPPIHGRVRCKG